MKRNDPEKKFSEAKNINYTKLSIQIKYITKRIKKRNSEIY
jgi:hypothetical protein